MGQSRAHHLADCYLKAAGVAGVYAERRAGAITFDVLDPVTVNRRPNRAVVCAPLKTARHLSLLIGLTKAARVDLVDAERFMVHVAETNGITVVAYETVIRRAFQAVRHVDRTFADLQHRGELADVTAEFKRLRDAGQMASYAEFIAGKKASLIASVALAV